MKLHRAIISVLLITLALPMGVGAQIEEIVVTAERRESTVQDTALSMTAVTGEQLDQLGAFDAHSLSSFIPNVIVYNQGESIVINSRGIGTDDVSEMGDPGVALHLDGVYAPRLRSANAAFYDIERIEFLRGPQGTLYGRNATSGSLNVIYNKPKEDFEASVDFQYGNYDQKASRGMINIPVNEKLALRGAYFFDNRDGYTKHTGLRDSRDADDISARLSALFTPTESISLLIAADYHEESAGGVGIGAPAINLLTGAPVDPRAFAINTAPDYDTDDGGLRAELNIGFDNWTLTYAPAFRFDDLKNLTGDIDGTPFATSTLDRTTLSKQHTQELRATSTEPLFGWDWLLGFYYFDESQDAAITGVFDLGFAKLSSSFDTEVESDSVAVFGNFERALTDQFKFTAGLRYTEDSKDLDQTNISSISALLPNPFNPMGPPIAFMPPPMVTTESIGENFDHFDWKVGLNWTPNENSLYYVHVSTAYKAGKFNIDGSTVNPEENLAYEVGAKNQFFDNTLQINAAFFYNDYTDLQVSSLEATNGVINNVTRNAAEATTWGFELEGLWLPVEGLRFEASVGILDAEYDSYPRLVQVGPAAPPIPMPGPPPPPPTFVQVDLAGNELKVSPNWNFTLAGQYTWQLSSLGSLTARVQTHGEDDSHLNEFNDSPFIRESFTKTDVRVTYRTPDERFSLEAYANNLEDNDNRNVFNLFLIQPVNQFDPPRTYGVRAGYRW